MITPALGLALVLVLLSACLHHALLGRLATDLGRDVLAAAAGFAVGEALARATGSRLAMLGALHPIYALSGAWGAMLLAAWGWRRAKR
ncbi:MAG: hypothetical protein ACH37Z_01095 [Anaerolineae bacterium]|jgi:hypothetical protein|nr:hypothetical protein [Ardenticatenia bacterium]MBK8539141.1 hypothetical protein [Ardenticatenia bacterium]HQZ70360.1 hypothetical protein [Anaerolineae bacterium]HRA20824.1 hypothetical protein [Anaerolineae bacterium]